MDLVERDGHLADLQCLLERCRAGEGNVVLLEGPAASGRTELLRAFGQRAATAGARVLRAVASRAEQDLPFGVVGQLLADLAPAGIDDDPTTVARYLPAVWRALRELAAEHPVVVAVDDVDHADEASRAALLYVARRQPSSPVLTVLTGDADRRRAHCSFRAELHRQLHFRRLVLPLLSRDGVAEMAARRWGPGPDDHVGDDLHTVTGGNPLLVQALIADREPAGGGRFEAALVDLLHRSGPEVLAVARASAVLGQAAGDDELGELAGADLDTVRWARADLVAAGVLDGDGFRDPRAAAAVLDDVPQDRRRELHHRAAAALHDRGHAASRLARHLVEADAAPWPWAVEVLSDTAERALAAGDVRTAVRALGVAHRSPVVDEDQRPGLLARITRAEWQLSPTAAGRRLGELTDAAGQERLAGIDLVALVRQLLWLGRTEEAVTVLDRLRSPTGDRSPDPDAGLLELEQWLAGTHPPLAGRPRALAGPLAPTEAPPAPTVDRHLRSAAMLAGLQARGRSREAAGRAIPVLRDLRLHHHTAWAEEATLLALLVLLHADDTNAVVDWCGELAAAGPAASPTRRAILAAARAEAAVRRGDLPAALDGGREALAHLSPEGWGVAVGLPLGTLVMAATRRGAHDEAGEALAVPVPDALFHSRYGLHYLQARGFYYLAMSHPEAAVADFLTCGELARRWGLDLAAVVPWRANAAEAWLCAGHEDKARRLVHDQLARPDGDTPRARGLSLRVLAAIGPVGQRRPVLTEALELFETCGDRFEQARVLTDLGRAYNAVDERRRARVVFRRARHMAHLCHADPLLEDLLSVPGGIDEPSTASSSATSSTAGPEAAAGVAALSSSERRVASLAVAGYTNREIAGKLYVTPSTVEQHLTQVYRKLAVKRRTDLPGDLSPAPAGRVTVATARCQG